MRLCLLYLLLFLVSSNVARSEDNLLPVLLPTQSRETYWEDVARTAALVTTRQLEERLAEGESIKLGDVRLTSVKVLQGQQERLTVELDGLQHRVLFSDERQWRSLSDSLPHRKASLDTAPLVPSALWTQTLEESAVLPDFTLTGPLELVLAEAQPVSLYVPHQADAGLVRCIVLEAGAALTIHNARSVALRRPVDLPQPSDEILADIWGRAVRGSAPGAADSLSGLLQMAHGLQGKAEGWRESQTVRASPQQALVSLELQLGEWSWLRSAAVAAGQPAPRLKVRKVAGRPGTVELTVRESQVMRAEEGNELAAAWVWPMPAVQPAQLERYENGLRELLARHGLNGHDQVESIRLVETAVDMVTLLSLEFELERSRPQEEVTEVAGIFKMGAGPHEVWRAVLALKPERLGRVAFVPLQAELVDATRSSIAISPTVQAMSMGNVTLPDSMHFVYPSGI